MKITKPAGTGGNVLVEWLVQEETESFFIFKSPRGSAIRYYTRSAFDSDQVTASAYREGERMFIPECRRVPIRTWRA